MTDPDNIERMILYKGYADEELGYLRERDLYFRRDEFDEGVIYLDGEYVSIRGRAEVRCRYISPYNLFIAPKESKLNNTGALGSVLDEACNALLQGNISISDFLKLLDRLPTSGYRQNFL
jgi:hypothetical protein